MSADRPLTLDQAAALAGRYRWVEQRLFELTGSWAPAAAAPAAGVLLDALSLQHAWHAELWAERLPVLDGADHDALTRPSPPLARFFGALAEGGQADGAPTGADGAPTGGDGAPTGGDSSATQGDGSATRGDGEPVEDGRWVARLTGLFRVVLPRLVVGYGRHLSMALPATDGPTIRVLRLTLRDEIEAWQAGEGLLERLVTTPAGVAAAAEAQRLLENILVNGGEGPGLVPWPGSPDARAGVPAPAAEV